MYIAKESKSHTLIQASVQWVCNEILHLSVTTSFSECSAASVSQSLLDTALTQLESDASVSQAPVTNMKTNWAHIHCLYTVSLVWAMLTFIWTLGNMAQYLADTLFWTHGTSLSRWEHSGPDIILWRSSFRFLTPNLFSHFKNKQYNEKYFVKPA